MRRLIGTLTDPSGTPLAGWTLAVDALRNLTPSVPIGAREAVVLDSVGGYDITVDDGLYTALLAAPGGTAPRRLGIFLVEPGTDIDILSLIDLYTPPGNAGTVAAALAVLDEGATVAAITTSLNFTGAGVTASASGGAVTIAVSGGGAPTVFTQASPLAEWIVNHNLGYKPLVDVLDTGGNLVGAEVAHISLNQFAVRFAAPYAGQAVYS